MKVESLKHKHLSWPGTVTASFFISRNDWKSRVISDTFAVDGDLLPWMYNAYGEYKERVSHAGYPCYFGQQAEDKGEMFYAFVSWNNLPAIIEMMSEFVWRGYQPQYARYNFCVFFEPLRGSDSHQRFTARTWNILQLLHDADPMPLEGSPSDADWEFSYSRCQMFVVGANPTYKNRRSRCLGAGQVLLFQPRTVFSDAVTNEAIGVTARRAVRQRLSKWDAIGHHPDLGTFGDAANREWKQYVLPDDNEPVVGSCPFTARLPKGKRSTDHADVNNIADQFVSAAGVSGERK